FLVHFATATWISTAPSERRLGRTAPSLHRAEGVVGLRESWGMDGREVRARELGRLALARKSGLAIVRADRLCPGEEAKMGRRGCLVGVGFLLLVSGAAAWWQRTPILAWYYVRQLCAANEEDRDRWVQRALGLDTAVVPGLLDSLARTDDRACANAVAGLLALVETWGPDDDRSLCLIE